MLRRVAPLVTSERWLAEMENHFYRYYVEAPYLPTHGDVSLEASFRSAETIVRAAMKHLQGYVSQRERIQSYKKSAGEVVTNADLEVEKMLRTFLHQTFPHHSILGEEEGSLEGDDAFRWYIDPIDGTGNFLRGDPHFCVSLALAKNEHVLLGIVGEPVSNTLYHAIRGKGAFRNGMPIKVNTQSVINGAHILWDEGHAQDPRQMQRIQQEFIQRGGMCTRLASAALECCAVASGEASACIAAQIRVWDVAAGILLVEEAGGRVTTHTGAPFPLRDGDLLVSNGSIHNELLTVLALEMI